VAIEPIAVGSFSVRKNHLHRRNVIGIGVAVFGIKWMSILVGVHGLQFKAMMAKQLPWKTAQKCAKANDTKQR
jgi:hypothetical protein